MIHENQYHFYSIRLFFDFHFNLSSPKQNIQWNLKHCCYNQINNQIIYILNYSIKVNFIFPNFIKFYLYVLNKFNYN
ncbi:hypothetical protein pb186bvf_003873 [Paramecium bursaria]